MRIRIVLPCFLFSFVFCLLVPNTIFSQNWTNGQNADGVLGQPDFTTGGVTAWKFKAKGVAIDPTTGKLFVADWYNHRVLRWSSDQALINGSSAEAVFGQVNMVSNVFGHTQSRMNGSTGVVVDRWGRLYVADIGNNRVLRFDNASSKTSGANADGVLGQSDFTTNTSATSANGMSSPIAVAVDTFGTLYVADKNNGRVLRFDSAATKADGANADGVLGQSTMTSGAQIPTSQSSMNSPSGLTVDRVGRLYVADYGNNRVLRFDNATQKGDGANADGVLGQTVFTTSAPGFSQIGMFGPFGVSVDSSGRLYVGEYGGNRVLRFDAAAAKANGANADAVLGQPDFTTSATATTANGFWSPQGLCADDVGHLFVVELSNRRLLRFDNASLKTNGANADGVLGQPSFNVSNYSSPSVIDYPIGVVVDPTTGKVFVSLASQNRVLRWGSLTAYNAGTSAEAVLGQDDLSSEVKGAAANRMYIPESVCIDTSGTLYVADANNNRVLRFDNASSKANGTNADGVLGQSDFSSSTAAATASGMRVPVSVIVDRTGTLWVSDRDNYRVLRFDNAHLKTNGAVADGVLGQADYSSRSTAVTAASVGTPGGLAMTPSGTLFVACGSGNRVLRFDSATTKLNGANADGVLGQPDYATTTANLGQANMYNPIGLGYDLLGRLYVTDEGNRRILIFENAKNRLNGENADYVLGQSGFTSSTLAGSQTASTLVDPQQLFVDNTKGILWVPDASNNRVLWFNIPGFPLRYVVNASSLSAAAGSTVTITAQLADSAGGQSHIGGRTVTWSSTGSGGSFSAPTSITDANGIATVSFTVDTLAGTVHTIKADDGTCKGTTGSITVIPGSSSITRSTVTISKNLVPIGDSAVVTLIAHDAYGNRLTSGGLTVVFALAGSGTSNGIFGTVYDSANGVYTSMFMATTIGTAKAILVTIGPDTVRSMMPTVTVIPGSVSTAQSTVSISKNSVPVGDSAIVMLIAKDAFENRLVVGGLTVAFSLTGTGTSEGTFDPVCDSANGAYTTIFKGTAAGTARTVSATIEGDNVNTTLPTIIVTPLVGIASVNQLIPTVYSLNQNFPNPFNPSTRITFALPFRSRVTVSIYNILGQLVTRLLNTDLEAGFKSIDWDGTVSSGTYILRLDAVSLQDPNVHFESIRKMLLMR